MWSLYHHFWKKGILFRFLKYLSCWFFDRFSKVGIERVNNIIKYLNKETSCQEYKKLDDAKEFVNNMVFDDTTTYVYQFAFYKEDTDNT